ncbi:MAG: hypothetical protein Kow0090_04860 [Myxococcota bacterium]
MSKKFLTTMLIFTFSLTFFGCGGETASETADAGKPGDAANEAEMDETEKYGDLDGGNVGDGDDITFEDDVSDENIDGGDGDFVGDDDIPGDDDADADIAKDDDDNDDNDAAEEPPLNYYGFVSYYGEEFAPLDDAFGVIKSLGAGWSQAEGPNMLSKAATWGIVEPVEGEYDFSSLDWVKEAYAQGVQVLLTINTGHDNIAEVNYSPYVTCDPPDKPENSCNCVPDDFNHWYQFVFKVVEHFDGKNGAPEVLYFQSMNEVALEKYYRGTKEQIYGGGESVVIHRNNGLGDIELPAAWIPVAYIAVHDANPKAKYVAGACTPGYGYPWAEMFEAHLNGASGEELVAIAERYNIFLAAQKIYENFEKTDFKRNLEFCLHSFLHSQYYDVYATHWYHPAGTVGFTEAMKYVKKKLATLDVEKPLWMTGTGIFLNLFEEPKEARLAYYLMKTLTGAYLAGVNWFDYSVLSDFVGTSKIGLYAPPSYRLRYSAADTFSMLSRIFSDDRSFKFVESYSPEDDVALHKFKISRYATGASGYAAIGWCLDEEPQNLLNYKNPDCPKEIEIAKYLGIPPESAVAIYNYKGDLIFAGASETIFATFDEAPFLIAFGDDADGDKIPDISDNCPYASNEEQLDKGSEGEIIIGVENIAIDAPDGIGYVCDNCPSISNRDQKDGNQNGIGDACEK